MKCEDLQPNLSLYSDGILNTGENVQLDAHLAACPLCRQRLEDIRDIRRDLRAFSRAEMPASLLSSIRNAVAAESGIVVNSPVFKLVDGRKRWMESWLLPSGIGAFASMLIGVTFLWILLSSVNRPGDPGAPMVYNTPRPDMLANVRPGRDRDVAQLTPSDYAKTRLAFAGESPSVNPQGALIALTKSLVRGDMRDDEVVVVADVFGNGLAQIAEVVEPSRDRQAVYRLERALDSDPAYSAFVPADLDQRADPVRVVLRIQSVDVSTRTKPRKH